MVQIFDKEILTDFLVIHQNFSYQIFLLAKANVVLVTVLSIFYSPSSKICTIQYAQCFYKVMCSHWWNVKLSWTQIL